MNGSYQFLCKEDILSSVLLLETPHGLLLTDANRASDDPRRAPPGGEL